MNDDLKGGTRPQGGLGAIAILLVLFGGSTIAMNILSFAFSFHELKGLNAALGVLCGAAFLATGVMILRSAASACRAYVLSCITTIAYWISFPELFTPYTMPGYAFAMFILFAGYRYISGKQPIT